MPPMLEIQLTVDDMVAYQNHFTRTRPSGRRPLTVLMLPMMLLFIVCGITGFLSFHGSVVSWIYVVLSTAAALFTWFWLPKLPTRAMRTRTRRMYPTGVIPPTRLWLDEYGLNTESAGIRTHYAWSTIRQIEETPTHAFVWVGEMQAVVVPRRVGSLQTDPFIEALRASTARITRPQSGPGVQVV